MNIALTNYGHKYTAELLHRQTLNQLNFEAASLRHLEEISLLYDLWSEIVLPYQDQPVYPRLQAQGLVEKVPQTASKAEIALRYQRNPLENITRIIFEYTTLCQFDCRHCYNTRVARVTEQDVSALKRAVDVFVRIGVRRFDFIGGEVSKYGLGWLDLVRHIRSYGALTVTLYTSGWWLEQRNFIAADKRYPDDAAYLTALKESGLSHIVFSLDGRGAAHDANRGQPGLYQRILRGLALVKEAGLLPRVSLLFRPEQDMDEFVLFLIELADRIYAFSPGTGPEEKANRLIADQSNSISNFIDIGSGAKDVSEGTELAETRDALLYCKGFFRPAPSLTIKANGEIATCRVANAGEGYGNLHRQDLIYILNHLQESFIFKLHAERRLGTYRRFVDPDIFGHTFTHQCTMRAILTLIARRMAEEGVDPEDQEAIARINREVAGYTGHLR